MVTICTKGKALIVTKSSGSGEENLLFKGFYTYMWRAFWSFDQDHFKKKLSSPTYTPKGSAYKIEVQLA